MIYKSRFTAKPKNVGVDIHLREVEWEDVDWIYLAHDIKNWEMGGGVSEGIC